MLIEFCGSLKHYCLADVMAHLKMNCDLSNKAVDESCLSLSKNGNTITIHYNINSRLSPDNLFQHVFVSLQKPSRRRASPVQSASTASVEKRDDKVSTPTGAAERVQVKEKQSESEACQPSVKVSGRY